MVCVAEEERTEWSYLIFIKFVQDLEEVSILVLRADGDYFLHGIHFQSGEWVGQNWQNLLGENKARYPMCGVPCVIRLYLRL